MSTSFGRYGYRCGYGCDLRIAMFAIQVAISLIQAIAAIASSAMTCKALCSCCRPKRDSGVVYYTNNGASTDATNVTSRPIVLPQQQPGYITIPISQIQAAAAGGATALPTEALVAGITNRNTESPPPNYETVEKNQKFERFDSVDLKDDESEEKGGSKYQRFE